MSNKNLTIGLIAVVIIAIGAYFFPAVANSGIFGSTACSGITCLSGGLRLVSDAGGDFESDVTSSLVGTTTEAAGFVMTKASAGITMSPTSTATVVCLKASAVGATSTFAGTMFFSYGACN